MPSIGVTTGSFIRRGAEALGVLLRETHTNDVLVMTKTVLEAAIPNRDALEDLVNELVAKRPPSKQARKPMQAMTQA